MQSAQELIVALILGGLAVLLVARLLPGFRIRGGFPTAVVVGLVYGVLKILLQKVLIVLTLPLVIVSLGLFVLFINAFLLWLTDKLVPRFTIRSFGSLFFGALLLSIIDIALQLAIRHSALF